MMAVVMWVFLTFFALTPDVTATSLLQASYDVQLVSRSTHSDAGSTPAPGASAGNSAGDASKAAPVVKAAPVATTAVSEAAKSNYVMYKPDTYYKDNFVSDSDNPLEELSFSDTYPTSRPLNSAAAGTNSTVNPPAASTTKANAAPVSPAAPKANEASQATPNTNASIAQITQPGTAETGETATSAEASATAAVNSKDAAVPSTAVGTAETARATSATASAPAVVNAVAVKATTCVTRKEGRAAAWFVETAIGGSPCVFGVDSRDEGSHCILEGGKFGTSGWCFTAEDGSAWGSCAEGCPLHGSAAAVAQKVDGLADEVDKLKGRLIAAKEAKLAAKAKTREAPLPLLQQRGSGSRNQANGPIEWIASWLPSSGSDLNASAQLAVSGKRASKKDSADSTVRDQVVAIPLQSQLLQESPSSRGPPANSSAMELTDNTDKKKHHKEKEGSGSIVAVKLQSQLLQKQNQSAPKSKETGEVVAVKLQSQLLQKQNESTSKSKETGAVVPVKLQSQLLQKQNQSAPKAVQSVNSSGSKTGIVTVKLQSQLLQKQNQSAPRAIQSGNSSESKTGVVTVKLQSQL